MNRNWMFSILIVLVVVAFFFGRGCQPEPQKPNTRYTDSLESANTALTLKAMYHEEMEDSLKIVNIGQEKKTKKSVGVYVKAKEKIGKVPCDSILPVIMNSCDTMQEKYERQLATTKRISQEADSAKNTYKQRCVNDSLLLVAKDKIIVDTVAVKDKQIKRLKRQNVVLKVVVVAQTAWNAIEKGMAFIKPD